MGYPGRLLRGQRTLTVALNSIPGTLNEASTTTFQTLHQHSAVRAGSSQNDVARKRNTCMWVQMNATALTGLAAAQLGRQIWIGRAGAVQVSSRLARTNVS